MCIRDSNKPLLSQVKQMTVITSNGNAAMSGGATEMAMTTPSGTNQFHGEAFWYNRNNAFSANDWFNNQSGVPLPFLNQNQMGSSIGGPIKKDRLFFYGTYEAVRAHQQTPADVQIPTATMRQGIYEYRNSAGQVQQVNLLTMRNISIDPVVAGLLSQVPSPAHINSDLVGDGLNSGGYRFNQVDNETRDNVTGRVDYTINTKQAVSSSFSWNRDNSFRPDLENDYSTVPKVTNPTNAALVATSWRWTPSARMTNEVRAGFNLTYAYFPVSYTHLDVYKRQGQGAGVLIILAERPLFADAGGAEEHHRIANLFAAEMSQGLQKLRQDAQGAGIGAVQELLIQIRDRPPVTVGWCLIRHFFTSNSSTLFFNSRTLLSKSGSF